MLLLQELAYGGGGSRGEWVRSMQAKGATPQLVGRRTKVRVHSLEPLAWCLKWD